MVTPGSVRSSPVAVESVLSNDSGGSFEKIVAETALETCQLAGAVDQVAAQYRVPAVFTSDKSFGKKEDSYNSYMHGRQYYYGSGCR